MKILLDPQHFDLPVALAYHITGALVSGVGILATTAYGCYHKLAVISPEELALQPLHVVLILFIVALATFIALILRAVWGKGLPAINKFSDALIALTEAVGKLDKNISDMRADYDKSVDKYQDLALDALKGAGKASKNQD